MPPPRETPLNNELLPGHSRFTLYFRFGDDSIEEIDIDANNELDATELALAIFDSDRYNPGGMLMAQHTAKRSPGELYF